jgi:hypothetical protein
MNELKSNDEFLTDKFLKIKLSSEILGDFESALIAAKYGSWVGIVNIILLILIVIVFWFSQNYITDNLGVSSNVAKVLSDALDSNERINPEIDVLIQILKNLDIFSINMVLPIMILLIPYLHIQRADRKMQSSLNKSSTKDLMFALFHLKKHFDFYLIVMGLLAFVGSIIVFKSFTNLSFF